MKEIKLNENNMKYISVTNSDVNCTCYFCGICVACIIFLPLTGLELAASLGFGLANMMKETS